MVMAFEHGSLQCEVDGNGTGMPAAHAVHFARQLREEYPGQTVAILPTRKSWLGGWPYD